MNMVPMSPYANQAGGKFVTRRQSGVCHERRCILNLLQPKGAKGDMIGNTNEQFT